MAAANDTEREKGSNKKKKGKATPKKERQISLRLSAKGAKRLNKLTEATEWSVTQVVEEALKVYAAREGIVLDEKTDADDTKDAQNTEEPPAAELTEEVQAEDALAEDIKSEDAGPRSGIKKLSGRKPKDRQMADQNI